MPTAIAGQFVHDSLDLTWMAGVPPDRRRAECTIHGRPTNLAKLRAELGVPPGSPEEVVLAGYRREGEHVFTRLRGDWIVVIADKERGTVLMARDQMGACQLCFHTAAGRTMFASDEHQLLELLPLRPAPDHAYMAHWLARRDLPPGSTPYAGIRRLRAGHVLRLDAAGAVEGRYWYPRRAPQLTGSPADHADRVVAELGRAITERIAAEGTTGVLLSGGLDSASIAALARENGQPADRAYCAVFPDHPSMDETRYIDILTTSLALPSTRIQPSSVSMLSGALAYLDAWQLPLTSPTLALWSPLLARAQQHGTTVMLDGEGGDAILGAARYLIADRLRAGRPGQARDLLRRLPGAREGVPRRVMLSLARDLGMMGALPAPLARRLRRSPAPSWMLGSSARALHEHTDLDWQRQPGPRWSAHLATLLTEGIDAAGVQDHLRRRAAMAGLEARHPFLDPDLLELVLRTPPELGFDPRLDRPLLRQGLTGILPEPVRTRRDKTTFSALMVQTLAREELPAIRRLLDRPDARIGAYVDGQKVRRELLGRPPAGKNPDAIAWCYAVWRLVTAECWLGFQEDPELPRRVREQGLLGASRHDVFDTDAA